MEKTETDDLANDLQIGMKWRGEKCRFLSRQIREESSSYAPEHAHPPLLKTLRGATATPAPGADARLSEMDQNDAAGIAA